MTMRPALSIFFVVSCIQVVGCYTATLWSDASAGSLRAEDVEGIIVDETGKPTAIAIRYSTEQAVRSMYARIPLGDDYSPSAPLRLGSVEGLDHIAVERLDRSQLEEVAHLRLQLFSKAVGSRSHRLKNVNDREFNLRLSTGAEVKAFAYWIDPNAGPDLPADFVVAVPAVLRRPAHERARSMGIAALLTPVYAAIDVGSPVLMAAMLPGFFLGIWEWP